MDESQRRRVCQLVAGMVISDDVLEPQEEAFLDRVIEQFGLADLGRDAIFPLVSHDEAAAAARELGPELGEEAFALLLDAAKADNEVNKDELEYLRVVAEALGVSEEDTKKQLDELAPLVVG